MILTYLVVYNKSYIKMYKSEMYSLICNKFYISNCIKKLEKLSIKIYQWVYYSLYKYVFFKVCRNDYIIIDLQNEAEGLEASIHWHGIFQNGFQYFDGVPFLTQCPIPSTNTFRYVINIIQC